MKDLTEQIYDELNAQVVRMLEHSLNQASRIAELETKLQEQDAMLGRRPCINNRCMDMVSAQSRIADLERQLAEASAPVEFPADGRNDDPAEAAFWSFDARKKGYGRWKGAPQSERDAFKAEYRAAIVAPQAANTDKVREAILALRIVPPRHYDNAQISAFCLGAKTMCEEAARLTASMAAQAPVREVPEGWQLVPKTITHAMAKEINLTGTFTDAALQVRYSAMLDAAPLPAAPVQQEGK